MRSRTGDCWKEGESGGWIGMEVFHVKGLPCQSNREKGNDVGGGF